MSTTRIENIQLVTLDTVHKNYGLLIENTHIAAVFPMQQAAQYPADTVFDAQHAWAMPGLIDLHIHGFAGYGPETNDTHDLMQMSLALAKQGLSAFCPTLYCAPAARLKQTLARLAPVIGQEPGARILGFHLEGPFISPDKAGAMKVADILPPDVALLQELYQAAQGKIAILTVAPELEHIASVVEFCHQHHIVVQAGHTNATYEQFRQGVALGITHATHAFNAMSPLTQRAPGAAGAVLMSEDVSCEFIGDGIHVHPQLISFLRKVKKPEQLILVTDALRPTAQPSGPFVANRDSVVLDGGVWRRTDGCLVGSALTLPQGIANLVRWGYPLPQAVRCASYNPAQLLHLKNTGQLAAGFQADITLLREDFSVAGTFIAGKQVA